MTHRELLRRESDKIFKSVYKVVVLEHQARTVAQLRVKTFSYSDDPAHTKGLVGRSLTRWLSIDAISKHLDKGHDLSFANHKDREKVYFIIKDYLDLWLDRPVNDDELEVPIDHIRRLDDMSDTIYKRLGNKIAKTAVIEANEAWGGGAGGLWAGGVDTAIELKAKARDRKNGTHRGKPMTNSETEYDNAPKRTRFSLFFGEDSSVNER